jgi:tetratricopeptide (TPR) repeat protein
VLAGQLNSAPEHIRRGIELSRACEALEVESWMHWAESDLWCESGEPARALASARQSHEIAERIDNPLSLTLALSCLGRALLLSGDAPSAIEMLTRADASLDRVHRLFQVGVVADLAHAYSAVGDLAEAKAAAQRSLAMAEQRGVFDGQVRARLALARVSMLQGGESSYAEALDMLDVAQSRAEQIGLGVIAPHLTELRGEIARRRGDHDVAEAAFEQAGWRTPQPLAGDCYDASS